MLVHDRHSVECLANKWNACSFFLAKHGMSQKVCGNNARGEAYTEAEIKAVW